MERKGIEYRMKKSDGIIAIVILAAAAVLFLGIKITKEKGQTISIYVGDALYAEYSLQKDQTVQIEAKNGAYNRLVIRNGTADMIEASCPDLICVHQKPIQNAGETIVCLPNRVVVRVHGNEGETDAVVQ